LKKNRYNGNEIIKQITENKIKQTYRKIEGQKRCRNGEIKRKHGEKGKESKVQKNKEHNRRERDVKRERERERESGRKKESRRQSLPLCTLATSHPSVPFFH
jgi:hypothetical protein